MGPGYPVVIDNVANRLAELCICKNIHGTQHPVECILHADDVSPAESR